MMRLYTLKWEKRRSSSLFMGIRTFRRQNLYRQASCQQTLFQNNIFPQSFLQQDKSFPGSLWPLYIRYFLYYFSVLFEIMATFLLKKRCPRNLSSGVADQFISIVGALMFPVWGGLRTYSPLVWYLFLLPRVTEI